MTLSQSVAEVLRQHVTLEVESIDRMYLNVYVPRLQIVEGVLGFLKKHRGYRVASTLQVAPISRRFVAAIEKFVRDHDIPLISFEKGQRKDESGGSLSGPFRQSRRRGLCRQGSGALRGLPHREKTQPEHP